MDSLAKRFRAARKRLRYSQKELAEKCGVSQQSVNKLELNKVLVPRKNALKIYADALQVNESWLMFGERPPSWVFDLQQDNQFIYVRQAIPIFGTTLMYAPDYPTGWAKVLVDSENAFGLRVEQNCTNLPYRIGTILAFNPDISPESNDMALFANPNTQPIIGIIASIHDEDEFFIENRTDGGSRLVNPEDYSVFAVMESIGRPRAYTKII